MLVLFLINLLLNLLKTTIWCSKKNVTLEFLEMMKIFIVTTEPVIED